MNTSSQSPDSNGTASPSRWRRLRNRAADFVRARSTRLFVGWLLGSILAIGLLGYFLIPTVGKSQLEQALSNALHREVTIDSLALNPFKLSVTLRGFSMREKNGDKPAASFAELYVNLSSNSLFELAPVLDALRLVKPHVRVIRLADKTYNYQDLIDEALAKPSGPTPRFSLNNIEVVDGRIDFEDQPQHATHSLTKLDLGIPFISSLASATDIKVQPLLKAQLDGQPIGLHGETRPFSESRETTLYLDVDALALRKYMDYVPVPVNFELASGVLDSRLTLTLATHKQQLSTLTLTGTATLNNLAVQFPDGKPAVAWKSLAVDLDKLDLTAEVIHIKSLRLDAPSIDLVRRADGTLSLLDLMPAAKPSAKPVPAKAVPAKTPPAKPFRFTIDAFDLANGKLRFEDRVPARGFQTTLHDITLKASHVGNAPEAKANIAASFTSERNETLRLSSNLQLSPLTVNGHVDISGVPLKALYPYYENLLNLEITDGTLDVAADVRVGRTEGQLTGGLTAVNAAINTLQLRFPGDPKTQWRIPKVAVQNGAVDLSAQLITMDTFTYQAPVLSLWRDADGTFNVSRILKPAEKQIVDKTVKKPTATPKETKPWIVRAKRQQVVDATVTFEDRAPTPPVRFKFSKVGLTVDDFTTESGKRQAVTLSSVINDSGKVNVVGTLVSGPQSARLKITAEGLPLVPVQPYIGQYVAVTVTDGKVSTTGQAEIDFPASAAPRVRYSGELSVTDLVSVDQGSNEDLLKWKSLNLAGLKADTTPLAVSIDDVTLAGFYSRLVLSADAKLNVQRLVKPPPAVPPPVKAALAVKPAEHAPAPDAPAAGPSPVRVGKITLKDGNINFSDFYVKPNYTANVTDVAGTVSELSPQKNSDVDLHGRLNGDAPVDITGQVNLLAKSLFLDIKASAKGIELAPLTPYAIKYAGYGIEKGKLSVNVNYHIEDRRLTAQNKVTLDQLTFGDRVESPTATTLPVRLAVALLKDRNGVIDIDLPISGSLNDPQFSVGGVIARVLVNLLTRAVTSPFALLGSLFGGGEDLSYIEFAPGSARLDAKDESKLKTLQKALSDRPALKVDITGRADPVSDRDALVHAALLRKVRNKKAAALAAAGQPLPAVDDIKVEPAEYAKFLTAAYEEEKFDKPRNVIGFAKTLPAPEMEQLMLKNIQISDDDLRSLAEQRARHVRDQLVVAGKISSDRVFIVAPHIGGGDAKAKPSRVDFALHS